MYQNEEEQKNYDQLLRKLEKLLEDDQHNEKILVVTVDEQELFRGILKRERGRRALGDLLTNIGGSIQGVITWLTIIASAYIAVKAGFLEWLQRNL